jgi:hypothetical protein
MLSAEEINAITDPSERMKLSISDMPKHPCANKSGLVMIGEMRNHFPDGHWEHRWERDGSEAK